VNADSTNPDLVFDAGNSYLKWGIVEDGEIHKSGRISHGKLRQTGFSALTTRLPRRAGRAMVSNVAGTAFATRLSSVIGLHCGIDVQIARCEKQAYGVANGYTQPRKLGVDRWAAMIGARHEFRTALCVVDAGTAITIDALDNTGTHVGGQILPGLDMMMASLDRNTSDIAAASGKPAEPGPGMGVFGRRTADAVRSGAMAAAAGAIEFSARRLREHGMRVKIVLTGGDASRILKQLNNKVIHRPHLVLSGLVVMLQNHE